MRSATFVLAILVAACGTSNVERGEAPADSPVQAQLGFVNEPGLTREVIVARLGEPTAVFEGGRVVSYSLAIHEGSGKLGVVSAGLGCFALLVEYAEGGAVTRHSLIRNMGASTLSSSSPSCRVP